MTATIVSTPLEAVAGLRPLIEEHADEADRNRRMSYEVIDAMKRAGLLQLWQPRSVGGSETPFPESLRVFEALGQIDGSAGWIVSVAAASSMLYRRTSEQVLQEHLGGDAVSIVAGGPAVHQSVEPVEGGYLVTGQWSYLSGCHHATRVGGFLPLSRRAENPVLTAEGTPEIRIVVFPREEAEILDTRKVTGLRATGSADVTVERLFVPEKNALPFPFAGEALNLSCQGPLYRLPIALQGLTVAAMGLGIAQHAIDAFTEFAAHKVAVQPATKLSELPTVHAELGAAAAALGATRAFFYEVADRAWEVALCGDEFSIELKRDGLLAGAHAGQTAAAVVDDIQRMAGGSAIYEVNPIERCFRDIHALRQHAGISYRNLEAAGAVLLGIPSTHMMLQ